MFWKLSHIFSWKIGNTWMHSRAGTSADARQPLPSSKSHTASQVPPSFCLFHSFLLWAHQYGWKQSQARFPSPWIKSGASEPEYHWEQLCLKHSEKGHWVVYVASGLVKQTTVLILPTPGSMNVAFKCRDTHRKMSSLCFDMVWFATVSCYRALRSSCPCLLNARPN